MTFKTFINNRSISRLFPWIIALLCFYYPLAIGVSLFMNIGSTYINVCVRGSIMLMSLLLIVLAVLNNKKELKLTIPIWFLVGFWVIYSARLVYDMSIGIRFATYDNSMVIGFAFGNILIPIVSMIYWKNILNLHMLINALTKLIVSSGLAMLIIILLNEFFKYGALETIGDRFVVITTNESGQIGSLINPIQFGIFGGLLIIVSFIKIVIDKHKTNFIYILSFALGIFLMWIGNSRGPFLSTALTLIALGAHQWFRSKSSVIFFLKSLLIMIILGIGIQMFIGFENIPIIKRLLTMVEEASVSKYDLRMELIKMAWQDYLDFPLIGRQFVLTGFFNYYPHNIIVEVLMATGTVGAILFLGFFIPILWKMIKVFFYGNTSGVLLTALFLYILIGAMFSGCLFQSIEFWILATLILIFPLKDLLASTSKIHKF